jgi:1,4-dihydroxy-2-naphthoate octaprenyltransferase
MSVKVYFLETRPQFLVLSLVLAVLASGMALASGVFNLTYAVLAFLGLLLLHVSVNTLNDYHDYRSGVDLETNRTPFNGGSGFLPLGMLKPGGVLALGLGSFSLAVPIGVYFVLQRGFSIMPLFLIGGLMVLSYTTFLTRLGGGIAEASAGLGLGTLPVIGIYYIITGNFTAEALFASVPSGILVTNLLLLNEIPDAEADMAGKRKTLPIILGKKKAAVVYSALTITTYVWIILGVLAGSMPAWTLLACCTLPFAFKAIAGSFAHEDEGKFVAAQGANVMVVLLTQLLIGVGFILSYAL